jgi:hypothetical protein
MNPRGSDAVAKVMADVIAGLVEAGIWRARLRADKARGEGARAATR